MTNTQDNSATLFVDSAHGIYIPQHFAETVDRRQILYVTEEDWQILESGPDHEFYWDAWDSVLNNAETRDGGVLYQDGDLWIVYAQAAIDLVNEACADRLDYEESHQDAGDNYSHMPAECWTDIDTSDLVKNLDEEKRDHSVTEHFARDSYKPVWQLLGIDPRWQDIEPDVLADLALESFVMQPGHMYGPYDEDSFVIAAYPVQEVEIDLSRSQNDEHSSDLDIDDVTMEYVRESCDACISGSGMAYVATDAVWYAVIDVPTLNTYIAAHFDE
jgi:hypothetical protein